MATSLITDTQFINVNGQVTLTITVGNAQAGGSYVVLIDSTGAKSEIAPVQKGVYQLQIPKQSILSCVTTVQDINLSTNDTCVDHVFSNNPTPFAYTKEVAHHNDKVVYDIQFVNI